MARNSSPARYTVRSASTVIIFWVGVVVLTVVVGVPLFSGDLSAFTLVVGPSLLLAWAFWIALYRPAVHYDETRAVIVNIGRRHVLPWARVTSVRQGIGLLFDVEGGATITASGVQAPRRPGNIGSIIDRRTRPEFDGDREADLLDSLRRSAPASAAPIESTWEVVPLVIGAILLIAVAIEFALGV